MNKQKDTAQRTVRIRAGGLPKGSAILKLIDPTAASEVRDLLQGEVLGASIVRTSIGNRFPSEVNILTSNKYVIANFYFFIFLTKVYINGLTENEDEAALFFELEQKGIVPKMKPDHCIQIQTAKWPVPVLSKFTLKLTICNF